MDTALPQFHDRLSTLEQENASLKSRLQSCERSHALLQAEIAEYRRCKQDGQEPATETIAELATPNNSALEHRLLEVTAEVANALLTIAPFDAAVNSALRIIGESLDTDRVNLLENFDSAFNSSFPHWRALGYEWNSPGTISQSTNQSAAEGSYQEIEWLYRLFQQGQTASYLIESAPEPFRSGQAAIGVKSTHLIPIFVEGKWWGVFGLDDCREAKRRSAAELSVLKIAADCIGSAIQRDRTQQALLQAEQERSQELERHNAELQQANATIINRERETAQLLDITRAIAQTQDSTTLLQTIYRDIQPIFGFDGASIVLLEEDQQSFRVLYYDLSAGRAEFAAFFSQPILIAGTPLEKSFFEQPDVYIVNVEEWLQDYPNYPGLQICQQTGLCEIFVSKLYSSGKVFGEIELVYKNPPQFDEAFRKLFENFANQVAVAVANILANEEIVEREREKSVLLSISEVLSRTSDRQALLQIIYQNIRSILPFYESGLFIVNEQENYHELLPEAEVIGNPPEVQASLGRLLHENSCVYYMTQSYGIISTAEMTERFPEHPHYPVIQQASLKEAIYGPLISGEQCIGMLCFWAQEEGFYNEKDLRLFKHIADQVAVTLANILANEAILEREAKLRESEKRYRTLFELSNEGIYRFELEPPVSTSLPADEQVNLIYQNYRYAEVNNTFVSMLGLESAEDAIGKSFGDFFIGDSATNREGIRAAVENGYQIRGAEASETGVDGQQRYILWNTVSDVHDGYVWGGWGMQTDITELKEAQQALLRAEQARVAELAKVNEELRQRDRLLEATATAANALLTIEQFDEAVNTALQLIGESLGVDRVCLFEHVDDQTEQSFGYDELVYEWDSPNVEPQILQSEFLHIAHKTAEEQHQRLRQGQTVGGILDDLPEPFRSIQAALGVKSTYAVPILIDEKFWGLIGFDDCRQAKRRSPSELAVLRTAANCISSAIQRNRIQQALLQAEQARSQELAKANEALKQSLDSLASEPSLDKFLGHVLKVVAEQLDAPLTEYWYHPEPDNIAYVGLIYWQGQILKPAEQPGHPGGFGYPVPPEMIHQESLHHRRSYFITDDITTSEIHIQIAHESGLDAGAWYKQHGVSRFLNVPLILGDKTIGALIVFLPSDRHFTEQQIELTYALAQQVTLAIQLTQLAEEAKQAAIAREQEKAAQERAAELAKANEALGRSLNRLANDRNLNSFLGHVLQEALQMLDGAIAQFFIYDPEADTLMPSVAVDLHGEVLPAPGLMNNLPVSESFPATITKAWERMLNQRSPVYFDIIRDADDYWLGTLDWHRSMDHCGSICTALMMGDQPLGMLGLSLRGRSEFTASEFEFFQALAQQATLAIQLTQLAEEAKLAAIAREQEKAALERAAELAKANESLRRSLRRLANERNLDAYLEHILREALQMLDGTIAQVFLYDSTTDTLSASVGVDQQGGFLPTPGLLSGLPITDPFPANITGIWQRLLKHRSAIQLDLDRDADDFWPGMVEWHRSQGNQAILCVPMLMGDTPLGLLGLASTKRIEFTASELEFTQASVQQATLAIQLTRLADEAKHAAILEERNRMASEIHDTLAQAFTGISLQLEVAKSLVEEDPQAVQQILNHISQLAEAGLSEARRSVWALYPPATEFADLAQLLYDSVEQMTRNTSTSIEVNLQGSPCSLPPFIGMNLLRIGQEALTNALKHAQAQTITIELAYEADRILLTIRDNGRGFTPPDTIDNLNGGFGLVGMYERCDRIGAQLSLTSQPGQGTQILVEAPLS